MSMQVVFLFLVACIVVDGAIPRRGMYVSVYTAMPSFPEHSNILGNTTNENRLFQFCVQRGINALSLYDVDGILPGMSSAVRSFVSRARIQGRVRWVETIAATSLSTWKDVADYQAGCTNDDQRFDGILTEIEYWAAGGTNVSQMLAPVNYLKSLNPVPRRNPLSSAWSVFTYSSYIGWVPTGQIQTEMNAVLDTVFIHAYVADPATSFPYTSGRLAEVYNSSNMRFVPIFSAEGASYNGGDGPFMGDWFARSVNNTYTYAEKQYYLTFDAAYPTLSQKARISGFQLFTYFYYSRFSNFTSNSGPWTAGGATSWPVIAAGSTYTSIAWCPTYMGSSTGCQNVDNVNITHDVVFVDMFDTPSETIAALKVRNWTNGTTFSSLPARQVICYFSAGTWENWRPDVANFSAAVRGHAVGGWPGEYWFNITNATTRAAVLTGLTWRLQLAASKGCDAVQPDNLDCWANADCSSVAANSATAAAAQLDFNRALANAGHSLGLAVGLINDLLQVEELAPLFDFGIQESCMEWNECNYTMPFLAAGKAVFHVEYSFTLKQVCDNRARVPYGWLLSSMAGINGSWVPCEDSIAAPTRRLEAIAALASTTVAPQTTTPAMMPTTPVAPSPSTTAAISTTTAPATTTSAGATTTATAATTTGAGATTTAAGATTTAAAATTTAAGATTTAAAAVVTTVAPGPSTTSAPGANTQEPTTQGTPTSVQQPPATTSQLTGAPGISTNVSATMAGNSTAAVNMTSTATSSPTDMSTSSTTAPQPSPTAAPVMSTTPNATTTPPPPTTAAPPLARAVLRIPGNGFAEILLSGNQTRIDRLRLAVRADIARVLVLLELYIIINNMTIGSLVTDFSVSPQAPVSAAAIATGLASISSASPSWLSNTQSVYTQFTSQGQAGEQLSGASLSVVSVATTAPTTVASIPTPTPDTTASSSTSGCGTACIGFAVAAALAGIVIAAIAIVLCCCKPTPLEKKAEQAVPTARWPR